MMTILKISLWWVRGLNLAMEIKEHDELDQEIWKVNSTRGNFFFNLYTQNIEHCLAYSSHAGDIFWVQIL